MTSSSENLTINRISWSVIAIAMIGLSGYVISRAYLMSFTHDEALSFLIIRGDDYLSKTANHHILNSFLMNLCSHIFGDSEWSFRMPNIFAHLLWMISCILLLKKLINPILIAAGFLLLNLNPFLLDFFSLARGYGLSLAFMTANLYCLIQMTENRQSRFRWFGYICGALAVLSNFTLLNYYLAFIAADILILAYQDGKFGLSFPGPVEVIENGLLIGGNLALFVYTLPIIFRLRRGGELYYGGTQFWKGAFETLIQESLYSQHYGDMTIAWITAVLLSGLYLAAALSVYQWIKVRKISYLNIVLFILILTLMAPIAQHLIFGTLYPKSRTGLYYIPLFVLILIFACNELMTWLKSFGKYCVISLMILFSALSIFHFAKTANLTHTHTWLYDSNTKDMMMKLIDEHKKGGNEKNVSIGIDLEFRPAINYYRSINNLNWLESANRDGVGGRAYSYYYCYPETAKKIQGKTVLIHSYPDTNTVFLKAR